MEPPNQRGQILIELSVIILVMVWILMAVVSFQREHSSHSLEKNEIRNLAIYKNAPWKRLR
jgi:hypothetical protein